MEDIHPQFVKGYELRQRIGRGGFGAVYRAYQKSVDREVAIKIILSEYANRKEFVRNFEIEAQLVARLEHPFIVPLFDYWRDDKQGAFIVMRLLRRGSLLDSLKSDGPWKPELASRLLDQIAGALTAAHKQGVVHQDIKTANILLDDEGNGYLTDFGIAKDTRQTEPDAQIISPDGSLYGSPEYMAPEQILRSAVDERADIYSLGIVLFEILTAHKPFANPDDKELVRDQLYKPLPSVYDINPNLPEGINEVLQRATDKHPRRRYASAIELADNFRKLITGAESVEINDPGLEIINPYKGLRAFQEADAADFFGREALVEQLFRRLNEPGSDGRFLAVIGASGSGKSSLVRAGLLPLLRRSNRDRFLMVMTPGAKPLEQLDAILSKISLQEKIDFTHLLHRDSQGLHEALKLALGDIVSELVLTIDQFEEVFTLAQDETERRLFIDHLVCAVTAEDSRLRLIITLRADFFDRPLKYPGLNDLLSRRTEVVLPMNAQELERAITKPAQRVGLRVEEALVKAVVTEVGEHPGLLPLLQYALTELVAKRTGSTLTAKAYLAAGGVSGALVRRAEEIYGDMTDEDARKDVHQLFLRLVTFGDGTDDTRRRARMPELLSLDQRKDKMRTVIEEFGKHRLLSFDHDPHDRTPTVEIAHEALIRNWQRLRDWLNENRDELWQQQQLANITAQWINAEKDSSYLVQGGRLEQFQPLLVSERVVLSADEKTFLEASINRSQRTKRLQQMGVAAIALVAVMMTVLAFIAVQNERAAQIARQQAETARLASLSRELAITAVTNLTQLDVAMLLSVEAVRAADTFEARNTLLTALESSQLLEVQLERYLPGGGRVRAVAVNGDLAAMGGEDRVIRLWHISSGQLVGEPLNAHTDWVNSVAFSPDGTRLASAGRDAQVIVWDTASGEVVATLTGHRGEIWRVAFAPDGNTLVSSGRDGLFLWDVERGERQTLDSSLDDIYSAVWSPDGTKLAIGNVGGRIELWNVADLSVHSHIDAHNGGIWGLQFSPDGRLLASGGEDAVIKLWLVEDGEQVATFTGHTDVVRDLTFRSSGQLLFSASDDFTIRVWSLSQEQPLLTFSPPNPRDRIRSLALTDDDTRLIVGTDASAAFIWNFTGRNRLGTPLRGHESGISFVTFNEDRLIALENNMNSPAPVNQIAVWNRTQMESRSALSEDDRVRVVTGWALSRGGEQFITADTEGTIRWSAVSNGETIQESKDSTFGIFSLALSNDGQTLAVGRANGDIHLWTLADGVWTPSETTLTGHTDRVFALAFSPDGTMLASGGADNSVRLWTLESGEVEVLTGHTDALMALAFSPDGRRLASGDRDNKIIVWDTESKTLAHTLTGHLHWVMSLSFSPDGHLLASGSRDQTVILWDLTQAQVRMLGNPLVGHLSAVNSVAFSPDASQLASGGDDGIVMLWNVDVDSWVQIACQTANRNFTELEWERYLHDLPYQTTCTEVS